MEEKVKIVLKFLDKESKKDYEYSFLNAFSFMCGAYPDMTLEEAWNIWKEIKKQLFE